MILRLKMQGRRDRHPRAEEEEEVFRAVAKGRQSKREAKGSKIARKKKQEASSSSESDDASLSSSS